MSIRGKIKDATIADETIIKTIKNCPIKYDDTSRVLLIDADSLLYLCTYFPEDSIMEFPNEDYQIEEAKFRLRNKIQEIQNNVEEWFNIRNTFLFISGKNNFRFKLYPEYKSHREKIIKSPLLPILRKYMIEELDAIESHGAEADDYVIEAMKAYNKYCIISCIDKDVLIHAPNVPIYDYRSYNDTLGEFKYITEKESRLTRASQLIIGDSADFVPGAKGLGKAWCIKNLHENMTDYQFIKTIFKGYLHSTKNDVVEAKRQMKLYYKILKLHTLEEINKFI